MGGELSEAIEDLVTGLKMAPLWLSLGWQQTIARFRRTVLGPFWLSANILAIAFAMTYTFGGLMGGGFSTVLPTLMTGLISWALIGGSVGEAPGVFIGAASMMTSQKLPLSFHVFLMMQRNFINFVAQLIAGWILFVLLRVGAPPAWPILIGIPIVLVNCFFIAMIVSMPSTRFRDITQLSAFIIQILFFITPVFWSPDRMSSRYRFLLDFNPFAHMLELIRQPMLGRTPALVHYVWSLSTAVVFGTIAVFMLSLYRKRVVFWL